jgi:hypothetical protein
MQPISTPKLSDEHRRPESNQAGVLVSSASSSMLSSSSGTEFLKPDNTASAFQAKLTMPFAVTSPLPLLEPELPADFVLALQSGSIISGLISPPLAREKKPSVGLVASRITDTHKSDLESTPVSEPANDTTANVTNNKKPMVVDSFPEKTIVEATITSSLMTSGNAYMERGDIASARLFYLEAVKNGFPAAMFAVGKTYDPIVLKKLGIKGFPAEPDKAVEWYMKAEKAGYVEASEYLLMLKQ